jgi:putative SOS response-associated peptidase YedK
LARWGMPSSHLAFMQATKKRAAKLEAKGSSSTSMNYYGWSPTVQQRISVTSAASTGRETETRCVVPFNSFSEFNKAGGGDIWFALDETRRLACFAGIWTNWTWVRKVRLPTTYSRSSRRS